MNPILYADLEEILERSEDDFAFLRDRRFFVTGGTGFVGRWLLEALSHANDRLALGVRITLLTRDPERFARAAPHLSGRDDLDIVQGDICDREVLRHVGRFDGIIHAATPSSALLNRERPLLMLDTIVEGGKNALEIASRNPGMPFVFTSSGAVYGKQPPGVARIAEDYLGAPDVLAPENAYHEGKRIGELLCAIAALHNGVDVKIARLFAFIGPFLPLDRHFAAGNFIRDALMSRDINVHGDGATVRSYLYASEMIIALLAVIARGKTCFAYNIGSEETVTVGQLARLISASCEPAPKVVFQGLPESYRTADRYVPNTERIARELNFHVAIDLQRAVQRTLNFYRAEGG